MRSHEPTSPAPVETGAGWLAPGDVIGGVYRVRSLLGKGGGGHVYDGDDLLLHRRVAIKVAPRGPRGDLLVNEAIALAGVRDPSVVTIHSLGHHLAITYVVMEYLYGVTLDVHLARTSGDGPRSRAEALDALIAICQGLAALHRAGLCHGDLKPANIMLAPGGRTVLLDVAAGPPEQARRTPHYFAPELLAAGAPVGSAAADLYAVGVIAYQLFTGAVPFDGPNAAAILYRHISDPPPELGTLRPDLPTPIVELVHALVAKAPAARPSSVDAVLWRLRDLRERPSDAPTRPRRVMVVDDDADVIPIAVAAVRRAWPGTEIDVAGDGADALRRIRSSEPDVILLDLVMPVMSGIELCTHLRSVGLAQRTQFVSIGARTDAHDLAMLNQLGITRFVPKGPDFVDRLGGVLGELARILP